MSRRHDRTGRPNVLFIMADQFRTKTMTGLGDGIETPNIDRIREQAVFFSDAACTSPLCTPSRASLATGKMPHLCGVMVHDANLPLDQVTYYQLLRRSGYRVAVAGKTDLHKMDRSLGETSPMPVAYELGFTDPRWETEGKMNAAYFDLEVDGKIERVVRHYNRKTKDFDDDAKYGEMIPWGPYQRHLLAKDPEKLRALAKDYITKIFSGKPYEVHASVLPEEDFLDNFIGDRACDWLREIDDEAPWHFFVSFAGPHDPWDPPKEELERLGDKIYPTTPSDNMAGKPDWVVKRAHHQSDGMTEADLNNVKKHYDGAVQAIDRQIGRMLDILEERGLADNTIVIFAADHGELMGEHGLFEKDAMYEGCLRVPLLIHLPGMKDAKEVRVQASLHDLAPTILDLCQAPYDPYAMDAISLVPALEAIAHGEEPKPVRVYQEAELLPTRMMCDGRYKWIRNMNDADELYDLTEDPDELHNVIDQNPQVMARFRANTFGK